MFAARSSRSSVNLTIVTCGQPLRATLLPGPPYPKTRKRRAYSRALAETGGLIAYSDDFAEELRQAAGYIDRILRGARVGELPVQQPTKFELVINMKAAKALGLTLSSGLLSIADEVIE